MRRARPSAWRTARGRSSRRLLVWAVLAIGVLAACQPADTTAPQPVTGLTAAGGSGQVTLRWTNPTDADLVGLAIVRKQGSTAPTSVTDGVRVAEVLKPTTSHVDSLLDAGVRYSYAVFAYDAARNYSTRATAGATTSATPPAVARLCGTLPYDITLTPSKGTLFLIDGCTLTIPQGRTLTLGAGSVVKAPSDRTGIEVQGALRSTGTATSPAVVTSVHDDTVGGNTDGVTVSPDERGMKIDLVGGGSINLDQAELRYGRLWDYDVNGYTPTASVVVTNSLIRDAEVDLFAARTSARLQTNTFTRSTLSLQTLDAPVVQGNTFIDGAPMGYGYLSASPVYVGGVADLSGITANTATGTPAQRTFAFSSSHVRTAWTLAPATGHLHSFNNVTIDAGATLTVPSGAVLKNTGSLIVAKGGTLTARAARFTSLGDDTVGGDTDPSDAHPSWPGIDVQLGATLSATGSTFTNASIAIEANINWAIDPSPYATVTVGGSGTFAGNGFDITNGPKDRLGGAAVDAGGSGASIVSSHQHLCVPPPLTTLPVVSIPIWDVEGDGRIDGMCLPTYTEVKGH